jgi:hypothetical protein
MAKNKSVSIRFKQQAYRLLKNHAFKPAYVFAEYIDNSIQSFKDNKSEILKNNKSAYLQITISKTDDKITIVDNAGGITDSKMESAFEPGSVPENNKGLNEFGIGLKNASVWMSDYYTVETSAVGEGYSKKVSFDYHKVIKEEIEDLVIKYEVVESKKSFTKIILTKLREDVAKFNFDQIGKELGSIYRGMLNSGELKITFLGKDLSYKQPEFLTSPYYPDLLKYKKGEGGVPPSIKWKFDFDIPYKGKRMHGFIGILKKMQKNENGISYCRRGRVIQGSGDEKMFPSSICSRDSSSHQRKRIFGEFNFEGFEVSFDKGKLLAEEDADYLINLLAEQLKIFKPIGGSKTYDFLRQAKELRVDEDIQEKEIIEKLKKKQKAANKHNESDENKALEEKKYKRILDKKINKSKTKPEKKPEIKISKDDSIEKIIPGNNHDKYLMRYTIKKDTSSDILYEIQITDVKDRGEKKLLKEGIVKIIEGYINVTCPFLVKNDQLIKGKSAEGFYEFMEYLMISEAISQIKGVTNAHYLRDTLNELINT